MLAGDVVLEFGGESFLGGEAERAGLILLAAMLLSFLFIRTSARLMRSPKVPWWPGSVTTEGGLHVHHLVFGIALMLVCCTGSTSGTPRCAPTWTSTPTTSTRRCAGWSRWVLRSPPSTTARG
jgi:hypothetical protein